jgi:hypothetical protein
MHALLLSLLALVSVPPTVREGAPEAAERALVLVGGTVHTMVSGEEPRVASVLIVDGRVRAVGHDLELAPGTVEVDVTGRHLVPALIDGYVNFDPEHDALYALTGIGLVRDIGGDHVMLAQQRDPEVRARARGPDLLTAGAVLDGDPPSSAAAVVLRDPGAAEELLPILFDEDVDFVSLYLGLTPEVRQRVIELAHEAGRPAWGPVRADERLEDVIASGLDGIHFLDGLRPRGVRWDIVQVTAFRAPARLLAESGTPLVPMFFASAMRLENQGARPDTPALLELLSPRYAVWWQNELASREATMTAPFLELGKRVLEKQAAIVKLLHESGVKLLPGSGSAQPWLFPGRALHQELELWVEAGIPDDEVLRMATRGAAEILDVAGEHGSIEPGAMGNVLILPSDPTDDIGAVREVERIVLRGELLGPEELQDMLDTVHARQRGVREALNAEVDPEPPPTPDDAVVLLEGTVETRSFGLRLSSERFRVARLADDRLAFLGRVVYPRVPDTPERELLTAQFTRDGRLESAQVVLREGEATLRLDGLWTANSWRMKRTANDQASLGIDSTRERPVVLDVGSVTTNLVLAMAPLSERFPAITTHEGLQPESVFWLMELDDRGQHQVRTHIGRRAFRLNDVGAPERALSAINERLVETVLLSSDAFGGPGMVLPLEKRRAIRERAEAAAARAEAAGVDQPTGEEAAPDESADEPSADEPTEDGATGETAETGDGSES